MALTIAIPRREARPRTAAPIVVAHRGASGHRPEHTLAGYELAFRLGADAVELDLLATRDGAVVCRHDVELSRTTDVAARPEYAHLRRTVEVDGDPVTGWFVHDFTLAELRGLRTRERWPRKRPTSASFNDRGPIPTFTEVLDLVARESARAGRRLGVYAELKEVRHLARHDLWLPDLVRGSDRPEITWMGFNVAALCALDLPERTVRLFERETTSRELSKISEYAAAVAVKKKAIYPRGADGRLTEPTKVVEKAHRRGLSVLVWSHRAENQYLPADFRIGGNPHGHGDAVGEAELFFRAGVDGLITDFPELGVAARQAYSAAISSA
ncbi:MAG: glycerophosphodiester phosphodiesterase [Nocardioidaceae bacterium]|nr:glycerophosphodiester phosphodiesterase [Nocardioidaceae bacterium]